MKKSCNRPRQHRASVTTHALISRRTALGGAVSLIVLPDMMRAAKAEEELVVHSDTEWKSILGEQAFAVMRREGTEPPFYSPLNSEKRVGTFCCAGCESPLFPSQTKYNSGTGWPSFYDPISPSAVDITIDNSIPFYTRDAVSCHRCKGHLGHVFDDGPKPTGKRYCMNGLALKFKPSEAV
jgi:peptide-methionine (R)-S-oxide reductase